MGEVIGELGLTQDVLVVQIDVSDATNWRDKFPVLKDRVL
jgi:predicted amidohydrolase